MAVSVATSTDTQSFPRNAFTSDTAARTGTVAASMLTSPGPTAGSVTLPSTRTGISMREASDAEALQLLASEGLDELLDHGGLDSVDVHAAGVHAR